MNTRSIRFRLTLWHAGLLTAVFVLLGALTFFALRHYLEANLRDIQALRARQIADTLLANVGQTGEAFVASEVKTLYAPEANGRFIRIIRGDGSLVYCSGGPKDESFDTSAIPKPPLTESGEFSRKEALPGDKALLIAALSYKGGNGTNYIVEVGAPLMRIRAMLNQLLILLALGLPIVLIAAVGGGLLLVQRALTPVDQIARKAEQITQNSLSERLPVTRTGDELERLSISLNHMIDRLENTVQNSKRFVADASHELRPPLTVLRGGLEQRTQDRRLDAGEAQTEWVPFDLAELAATTADQMNLLAEDKGISVLCEAKQPVLVEGDRARLKQVVVNLLDNAIKYTSGGGKIHLRVARQNGHALLEVEDNGIGIPVEALPHVFERFFRVDKARSRDQGGAGLGLSIVKSICTAHGAEVQVESAPGKGSRFRVTLPMAGGTFSKEEIKNENGIKN